MFQGLLDSQIESAIEALLFVTDEPVSALDIADMLEVDPQRAVSALASLKERLARDERGIQLREVAGGWRLYTHPVFHELIEAYVVSWDTRKLSQAALETLSIIAYLQPATRATVASVRGVNSDSSINSLVEKGLVREMGIADTPGNPMQYGTTRAFLEKFGLRCVDDLPDIEQFAPDDQTRALIRERLSATRIDDAGVVVKADAHDAAPSFDDGDDAQPRSVSSSRTDETAFLAEGFARADGAAAFASTFGLVEKIDFDSLTFETDDE